MITIHPVQTKAEIAALAQAADKVWHEYFSSLLTPEQIDYMVEKFQSVSAMTEQLANGYLYFTLQEGDTILGYTGIHPEETRMFLSKLYVLKDYRRKGYSSLLLKHVEALARQLGKAAVYLTVNKYNTNSIEVYQHQNFRTIDSVVTEIGRGFVMDDYIMEKILA